MGERARRGGLATVSNVVSDHGWSGAGRDDANRREAAGRRLGVVEHGSGTIPLVLLHGWPQTSYAWRHVTPLLASDCHTLAYDLPGIGSSEPATDRFDKWSISGDLHASLDQRGIQRPLVVGHGMGAQVAYAYLRRYPAQVRGVMLLDTPIAGVGGCEDLFTSSAFWHIGFHQTMSGRHRPGGTAGRRPGASLLPQPHRPVRRAPGRDQRRRRGHLRTRIPRAAAAGRGLRPVTGRSRSISPAMRAAPAAWNRRFDWRSPSSRTPPSCLRWPPDCAKPALAT